MTLSQQQIDQYHRDGFILVSDLISSEIVQNAKEKVLLYESAPHSFKEPGTEPRMQDIENDRDVLACFTKATFDATVELCGDSYSSIVAPTKITTVNVYPGQNLDNLPYPHVDHAFKGDRHKIYPPPYRIATIIFFTDVGEGGGGTVLWPGSHHQLDTLARSNPIRYSQLHDLYENFDLVDFGETVNLTPKAGDVLFYHYLCAHSGSPNRSQQPRLAMNHKWVAKI